MTVRHSDADGTVVDVTAAAIFKLRPAPVGTAARNTVWASSRLLLPVLPT